MKKETQMGDLVEDALLSEQSQPTIGETVGQRLRRLRLERGLTLRQLAAPGVTYAYISHIEAGRRTPSVTTLRKLALNLGVNAQYLETGIERSLGEVMQMLRSFFPGQEPFLVIRRRDPAVDEGSDVQALLALNQLIQYFQIVCVSGRAAEEEVEDESPA